MSVQVKYTDVMPDKYIRSLAYHEAAHAVAGVNIRYCCHEIRLDRFDLNGKTAAGGADMQGCDGIHYTMDQIASVQAAGFFADMTVSQLGFQSSWKGAHVDWEQLRHTIIERTASHSLIDDETTVWFGFGVNVVEKVIGKEGSHRSALDAVVDLLVSRYGDGNTRTSGEEVYRVIANYNAVDPSLLEQLSKSSPTTATETIT